jgi:formate dehydrogenase subunit gamma
MPRRVLVPARMLIAAVAIAMLATVGAAMAQQSPTGSNPTAMAVTEEQLFQELDKLKGRVTLPDGKLAVLEQPQGRDYRRFHEAWLPWIGGVLILAMIAGIALFYFTKGPVRLEPGEASGRRILRFDGFERFVHWMTATSFILLAITGLNYFLGKRILMPLLGPDAFAAWSQWAKYGHNFLAWPFILGVLLMAALWARDNLPDRYDAAWLKAGGGLLGHEQPPSARFNAGQKLIFWSVLLGGIALAASGIVMLFPFSVAEIGGMQTAQYVHAIVGVVLIAIVIAHIYIGTIGMEGAWDAMGSGEVDLDWARHHHPVWVEDEVRRARQRRARSATAPAE